MAHAADPTPAPRTDCNEQTVRVPIKNLLFTVELETTLFPPPGPGPFPLVVINHGKASGNPKSQERACFLVAT
jgi:dienelactone hydrolase